MTLLLALIALIVLIAFVVEAALGFGATVVAVSLGAFLLPLDELLPIFVPLNVALSAAVVTRDRRLVDRRLLALRVLPFMALGLPLGMLALTALEPRLLKAVFGAFVIALSLLELSRKAAAVRAMPAGAARAMLAVAGAVHGAFATGGPLVVYVLGRSLEDKGRFRATLSALWLCLNLVLVLGFWLRGELDESTLVSSAKLAPALVGGLALGELLHRRVPAGAFRRLVFGLLLIAGALLLLKG